MRRQRVLRAPSAQSLCIFCACRLGVDVPQSTIAPLVSTAPRRGLSTARPQFQQAAAATAASSNDDNAAPSNAAQAFTFDPNSSLTFSEQQEKARRMQARSDQEAKQQQLKQEGIWRESEARRQASNASKDFSRSQNGNQDGGFRPYKKPHAKHMEGPSIPQAMVEKRAQARETGWKDGDNESVFRNRRRVRSAAPNQDQERSQAPFRRVQLDTEPSNGHRPLVAEKAPWGKRGNSRASQNSSLGIQPEQTTLRPTPERRTERRESQRIFPQKQLKEKPLPKPVPPRRIEMPSFLGSSDNATAPATSGWGVGDTEVLPVEYGDASQRIPVIDIEQTSPDYLTFKPSQDVEQPLSDETSLQPEHESQVETSRGEADDGYADDSYDYVQEIDQLAREGEHQAQEREYQTQSSSFDADSFGSPEDSQYEATPLAHEQPEEPDQSPRKKQHKLRSSFMGPDSFGYKEDTHGEAPALAYKRPVKLGQPPREDAYQTKSSMRSDSFEYHPDTPREAPPRRSLPERQDSTSEPAAVQAPVQPPQPNKESQRFPFASQGFDRYEDSEREASLSGLEKREHNDYYTFKPGAAQAPLQQQTSPEEPQRPAIETQSFGRYDAADEFEAPIRQTSPQQPKQFSERQDYSMTPGAAQAPPQPPKVRREYQRPAIESQSFGHYEAADEVEPPARLPSEPRIRARSSIEPEAAQAAPRPPRQEERQRLSMKSQSSGDYKAPDEGLSSATQPSKSKAAARSVPSFSDSRGSATSRPSVDQSNGNQTQAPRGFGLDQFTSLESSGPTPSVGDIMDTREEFNEYQAPPQANMRQTEQSSAQQQPSHRNSGYRTTPFDPNEFGANTTPPESDYSANWQHLRRKTSGSSQSYMPEQPPPQQSPFQQPPRQQQPRARAAFLDDVSNIDEIFERHRETRPPPPPPATNYDPSNSGVFQSRHDRNSVRCGRCQGVGHVARDCPNQTVVKCHTCGGVGHLARECPNNRFQRGGVRPQDHLDDPYASERPPPAPRQRADRRQQDLAFNDPFARPQQPQRVPSRQSQPFFDGPSRNGRAQDTGAGDPRRPNPFDGTRSTPIRRTQSEARQPAERTEFGEPARDRSSRQTQVKRDVEKDNADSVAATPSRQDVEEDTRREARASRRNQKWADDEGEVVSERFSDSRKGRKERRGGRREFEDEEDDEVGGAREVYRARKAERQAEQNAAQEAKQKATRKKRQAEKAVQTTPITLPEYTSVQQLSQLLGVRYEQFVERLEDLGYDDLFPNKTLNSEASSMIAMEYNFEPVFDEGAREEEERDLKPRPELADKSLLPERPPVVTIMGHVDHGKTTILDYLRKSSVAAGEAGGITQHIGAFSVPLSSSGKTITFLDTPGHAAFLAMRQRGANVTDIVILVVAADDSVKPQTLEALKHAKAAGVPMIVAINKVDKDEADVQRCKNDLARHGVEIEEFGGEIQVVEVSGKTGKGMDVLEENIVTLSEILDHRAETDGPVEGWVLEATTKKAGRVATVLVRRGTLKPGSVIVAGKTWARVRSLSNEAGKAVKQAGPGTPVEVDGWREQPAAGDEVLQAETEQKASSVVEYRLEMDEREKIAQDTEAINEARRQEQERKNREKAAENAAKRAAAAAGDDPVSSASAATSAEEQQTGQITVPFIIKADVSGSAEAVSAYIMSVSNPLITPQILSSSVGAIHESDIDLAEAANGHIIAFNLPPDNDMNALAEHKGVKILENNIIYRVLDDVKAVLEEKLPPIVTQRVLGEAEVAAGFEIGLGGRKKMKIAGCKVRNGVIGMRARVRVTRNGQKVYEGTITSLKNVKKDVQEMRKGTECGMAFDGWEGFENGDQIQTFEEVSEKRKL